MHVGQPYFFQSSLSVALRQMSSYVVVSLHLISLQCVRPSNMFCRLCLIFASGIQFSVSSISSVLFCIICPVLHSYVGEKIVHISIMCDSSLLYAVIG